jgi:DNA-binding NtrC family response regulator
MAPLPDTPDDESAAGFRWQTFFQHASEPVFLLNRRRRLLFANRAWEECTGVLLAAVRGRPCRRSAGEAFLERESLTLAALSPPAAALAGEPCQVRRRLPGPGAVAAWWEVSYLPLAAKEGVFGVLGRLRPLSAASTALAALPERLVALRDRHAGRYRLEELGGDSAPLQRVREQARLAAEVRLPVLLIGEAGVGKEWLARAIHQRSPARHRSFARLDCARLPPQAVAEILFGPRHLLFSVGSVYLRESGSLPREAQERLAKILATHAEEEGAALPRFLLGMRGDPEEAVRSGRLLEELYCRASTLTISVPPLRARLDELPRLLEIFLRRAEEAGDHKVLRVSAEALRVLGAHAWPENLRELYTVVLGACRHARGEEIEVSDLPFQLRHGPLPAEHRLPLDELLESAERRLIELALRLARNNKARAADLLAIWRPRLLRRMEHFGLLGPAAPAQDEDSSEA